MNEKLRINKVIYLYKVSTANGPMKVDTLGYEFIPVSNYYVSVQAKSRVDALRIISNELAKGGDGLILHADSGEVLSVEFMSEKSLVLEVNDEE